MVEKEKEKDNLNKLAKIKKFKNYQDIAANSSATSQMLYDQKELNSMLKRTMRLYDYEFRNKLRNEIIE